VVNFTIDPNPPVLVARDDFFSVLESIAGDNAPKIFTVSQLLGNDTGTGLTITSVTTITTGWGTAVLAVDGQSIIFTPNNGFEGNVQFTYEVTDGTNTATATATVTVNVFGIDARNDAVVAQQGTPLVLPASTLTANDIGNISLTITAVGPGSNGAVTLVGTDVIYTPNAGFRGFDTFTYTVTDADGNVDTATVSVDVQPVAVTNNFTALERVPQTYSASTLLGDDRGTGLTIVDVGNAVNGTVSLDGSGNVIFTPNNVHGAGTATASFTYTIRDSNGKQDTATVNISVFSILARNDGFSTPLNTAITLNESQLLANDSGNASISIQSVSEPVTSDNYSFAWDEGAETITITPTNDFSGTITFSYTMVDVDGETSTATVSVFVSATATPNPNTPPVANPDSFVTLEDIPLTLSAAQLLGNDSGDQPLGIVSVQAAVNGTVALVDGQVIFHSRRHHR